MDHQIVAARLADGEREMLAAGVGEGSWSVREALDQLGLMVVTPTRNFANRTLLDSLVQRGLARLQGYGKHCTNYEITTDGRDVARLIGLTTTKVGNVT
jgi:hypothetical protein